MVRCEKCRKEAWTKIDDTWLCPECAARVNVNKILEEFRTTIDKADKAGEE